LLAFAREDGEGLELHGGDETVFRGVAGDRSLRIVNVGLADHDDARGKFETDVVPCRRLHGPSASRNFLHGNGREVNVGGGRISGPPDFFVLGQGGSGDFGGGAVVVFGVCRLPAVVEGGGKPEQGEEEGDGAPQNGFLLEGLLYECREQQNDRGKRGNEMPGQQAMIEEEHGGENRQAGEAQGEKPNGWPSYSSDGDALAKLRKPPEPRAWRRGVAATECCP